ncbi:Mov34/MPN/PAD-1 family protein [Pseudomonas guariconensis]|uniref:Mov34/MPN/PAD-1 family protein n=1 Tax=Pseudomonas guariconensis TaxID=1288410 RepID=UPI003906C178
MNYPAPLSFVSSSDSYTVTIEAEVLSQMVSDCIRAGTHETGGILIGKYSSDGSIALISEITSHSKDSISSSVTFQRGIIGLKELLAERWNEGSHYIGEWHYHPGGSPEPSDPDIRAMRSIATNSKYSCREPILVILGGTPPEVVKLSATVFPANGPSVKLRQSINI